MAERRLWAVVGLEYPKDAKTLERIRKGGGIAAVVEAIRKTLPPGFNPKRTSPAEVEAFHVAEFEKFRRENYVRVEAGEAIKGRLPGKVGNLTLEEYWLRAGKLTAEKPGGGKK